MIDLFSLWGNGTWAWKVFFSRIHKGSMVSEALLNLCVLNYLLFFIDLKIMQLGLCCKLAWFQVLKLLRGDDDVVKCARSEVSSHSDAADDEIFNLESDIRSHLTLALLDVEDDTNSVSSTMSTSVENYLQWRSSCLSNFN